MESLLDSMTITLSRPFIIKGESRDTITIREPKLRDRIMFSNDKSGLEERTATMLARLAYKKAVPVYLKISLIPGVCSLLVMILCVQFGLFV